MAIILFLTLSHLDMEVQEEHRHLPESQEEQQMETEEAEVCPQQQEGQEMEQD